MTRISDRPRVLLPSTALQLLFFIRWAFNEIYAISTIASFIYSLVIPINNYDALFMYSIVLYYYR